MSDPRDTPAMRQYARFKQRHPDCLLLFRIGDFYEAFDDDAVSLHRTLGLTLTQRTEGIPMAGIPWQQLEVYLQRLIGAGFRVAVCDQIQDPRQARGIVERAVTRVLTPGTLVDESLLEAGAPNCLAAVSWSSPAESGRAGVAVVEVSTGSFVVFECEVTRLGDELAARRVTELLYPEPAGGPETWPAAVEAVSRLEVACTPRPAWQFSPHEAMEALRAQYGVVTLAGFGLRDDGPMVSAAGAIVRYLMETQMPDSAGRPSREVSASGVRRASLAHLSPPRLECDDHACVLDATTLRALEVERTLRGSTEDGSLLGLLTSGAAGPRTAMGRRLMRQWLCRPSRRREEIERRHRRVAALVEDRRMAQALGEALGTVQDVARIAGRLALARATPRDLAALAGSLAQAPVLADTLRGTPAFVEVRQALEAMVGRLVPLGQRIARELVDRPPLSVREGGVIRDAVDAELDEARMLQRDASEWLAAYQRRLAEQFGLPSLRVGYNRVFGYYIELPAAQARQAPGTLVRKQTLRHAERFTTPELESFQQKVASAQARALERERVLFEALCAAAGEHLDTLTAYARLAAELDVLWSFAEHAYRRQWCRPAMTDQPCLRFRDLRHPVLEERLRERFVPNDLVLGGSGPTLALITGPNMAGKSTFIRQTALAVLLAHAGSFVPAREAEIGLTDRIFTRVGADDALHAGQSTFMVEMTEAATILNNATPRSLVILDEIGRGTSTLDGLSLAWAIAEHLAAGPAGSPGPRTLFATHYHELTELEDRLPGRVRNLHVAVREWGDDIIFVHRILPGRTSRSYGIHVAKLAGIPAPVVQRAREVLASLSVQHHGPGTPPAVGRRPTDVSKAPPTRPSGSPAAQPAVAASAPSPHDDLLLFPPP